MGRMQNRASILYLSLLIRSRIVTITTVECVLAHSSYKMLLAFEEV